MGLIACKVSEGGGVTKGWWTLVMGRDRDKGYRDQGSSPLAVERSHSGRAKTNTRRGWGVRTLYLRERCFSPRFRQTVLIHFDLRAPPLWCFAARRVGYLQPFITFALYLHSPFPCPYSLSFHATDITSLPKWL